MKKCTIVAEFESSLSSVWEVVTNNKEFDWRSDLSQIIIADDSNSFIEITKEGFETEFVITLKKQFERYEFDIKNKNMNGHWVGCFSNQGEGTRIEFTEEIQVENPIIKLFIGGFLRKQQVLYVSDLRKALGE